MIVVINVIMTRTIRPTVKVVKLPDPSNDHWPSEETIFNSTVLARNTTYKCLTYNPIHRMYSPNPIEITSFN